MITHRQEAILKAIVEDFVQTAEPVGSKTLMTKYNLPYSSATIRNDMMALEQAGYLEKTHTSSGRVPSTEGYRYYVERLMETSLDEEEMYALQKVISDQNSTLEEAIAKSCDVLSHMTNLTSIVLGPDARDQKLQHIQLIPLDDRTAVAVFITNQGHTENKTFRFEESVSVEDIQNCCDILNDRLVGTEIREVVAKMNEIKPILANQVKRYETLYNAFIQAFVKFASENMYYRGASNMLYQPEFADIDRIRGLMKMLEDSTLWHQLTKREKTTSLHSASKSELVWMDDLAIVSTTIQMHDQEGQLMILGPSRMEYDRITSILDYISSELEERYGKK